MKEITSGQEHMFTKGAKLNFEMFPLLDIEKKNLEFMHLISSVVLSGHLKDVCFYNASFLSTKFSEVLFKKCNLKSTDMCSLWVKDCQFLDCDFSDATISDSTFINCDFKNAILESISLTRCQFINCHFDQISTDDSTISLNTFTNCRISGAKFEESFYYQIFENCTFNRVDFASELLGYNFGLSPSAFSELFHGVDFDAIDSSFTENGLYVNAAILRINLLQRHYDEAMIACVVALGQMITQDILIKADEIEFLKSLAIYFQKHQQIAPISVVRIWQLLTNFFMAVSPNTATSKALPHIQEFANTLYFSYIEFQKNLQDCLMKLPRPENTTDTAELQIIYLEKPSFPLLDWLIEMSSLAGPMCPKPHLIRTEAGSFHEFHEISLIIMPYLQTLFSFLNVLVPIEIYKKQKEDTAQQAESTRKESLDKREIEITVPVISGLETSITLPNTEAIAPETISIITDTINAGSTQELIAKSDFSGYNTQNIQSITIRIH